MNHTSSMSKTKEKNRIAGLVIFIATLIFSFSLTAQNNEYKFVGLKKDVAQRAIATMAQDSIGFLWLGTNGAGVIRYDGTNINYYKSQRNDLQSLSSSIVHKVFIDSKNRLWVGNENGLNLYDRNLDSFISIDLDNQESFPVHAIAENKNADLLIGTHGEGIYIIQTDDKTSTAQKILANKELTSYLISSIVCLENGDCIVGSNFGISYFGSENLKLVDLPLRDNRSRYLKDMAIESMIVDKKGTIWAGTQSNGILKINKVTSSNFSIQHLPITQKRVLALVESPEGTILGGTENDGLFILDSNGQVLNSQTTNKFKETNIQSNSIWSLFKDDSDRIWAGYYNNELAVCDKYDDKFQDLQSSKFQANSLQSPSVSGIEMDSIDRLWIAMDGGGVDVYDAKSKKYVHLADPNNKIATGLQSLDVQTIFFDSRGGFWVGTWSSGIFYLSKGSSSFQHFPSLGNSVEDQPNRILSFAEGRDGVIWIGSFLKGLYSYNLASKSFQSYQTGSFKKLQLDNANIRKVLVDHEGHIWLGTTKGLFELVPTNKIDFQIKSHSTANHPELQNKTDLNIILSLFEDNENNLWIGTEGAGLFKYQPSDEKIVPLSLKYQGVPETVTAINQSENGEIWISGSLGLYRLQPSKGEINNFNTADGLLSNDYNFNAVLNGPDGQLYFGNNKGIDFFDPSKILKNDNIPKVYLTDLKVFNESIRAKNSGSPLKIDISQTRHLELNSKQSVFSIEYAAVNFTRSEKNQYAYYLEGFEDSWNFVGNNRIASYTNLPPGDYVFKLKASNNDNVWMIEPLQLKITILAPWYKTSAAIIGYFLLALTAFFLIYKIAKGRIVEKRLIKFEREKRIQEEELNSKKLQFFTNISHEFRTPLTLILNPLEDILRSDYDLPEVINRKHQIIHKNSSKLVRLINELMDFRKLQFNKISVKAKELNVHDLVLDIVSYFQEESIEKKISLQLSSNDPSLKVWADSSMVEKIIFNLLSNAFKATPENGTIDINISKTLEPVIFPLIDDYNPFPSMQISIADTGRGISKNNIEKIFDRFYQAKEMDQQYYGGTGIGLEVVRNFINLHKGKIEVESEPQVGTTFKIFLPLGNSHFDATELVIQPGAVEVNQETPKSTSIQQSAGVLHPFSSKVKTKTLLIIEDNNELRSYLNNELSDEYKVQTATDGREGLETAQRIMPDVIITDVLMPEMDGYDFCQQLKKDIKTSHIPVLMLTAKAMTDDWIKGIEAGADIYLNKPFDMRVLRSQLQQLIKSRQVLLNKYMDGKNVALVAGTRSIDEEFMIKVIDYIHENLSDSDLNVENLAAELYLSRSQLYRKIKALTGKTANEFLKQLRLNKAMELIKTKAYSISEVCYKVGFSSPSYFTKCFKVEFGILPTEVD